MYEEDIFKRILKKMDFPKSEQSNDNLKQLH